MFLRLHFESWIVALLAYAMTALAAVAEGSDSSAVEQLRRGEVVATVSNNADDNSLHVAAAVEIPASRARVWLVMVDCERAPSYVPGLLSCRVLDADPAGRWDVREHLSSPGWLLPNMRTVFRSEYDPPVSVSVSRVAGDLAHSTGEWRLESLNGGQHTRITYAADIGYETMLPGAILRSHLRDQMVRVLTALKEECTSDQVR